MKVDYEKGKSGGGAEYILVQIGFAGLLWPPQCIPMEYAAVPASGNNLESILGP